MIEIGEINKLTILRDTSAGMFLGDDEGNDVLLPGKYIMPEMIIGQDIEVFIYRDSEDRIVATTQKPLISLHTFAYLQAVAVNSVGAFMGWGLDKDLLVPFREQPTRLSQGQWATVFMTLDARTGRLVGSCKVNKFLEQEVIALENGQAVTVLFYERSDLGFNVIINHKYRGLVFFNEIFQPVYLGLQTIGYVKNIRPDNRIDIVLQPQGQEYSEALEPNSQKIISLLRQSNGFLPLHDNSDPFEIYDFLAMSKKTFKKTAGTLYRNRIIRIEPEGIYLLNEF